MKYFGGFGDYEGMLRNWKNYAFGDSGRTTEPLKEPVPSEDEVLFASYGGAAYEGDAVVIFRKDGKLFEVHGSHCSCHGLEGQWEPEETTIEVLAAKGKKDAERYYHFLSDHEYAAYEEYWKLVDDLIGAKR